MFVGDLRSVLRENPGQKLALLSRLRKRLRPMGRDGAGRGTLCVWRKGRTGSRAGVSRSCNGPLVVEGQCSRARTT